MRKNKKYISLMCCVLVALLLLSTMGYIVVGNVSAKYAKDVTFAEALTVPKNYYSVTYHQIDDSSFPVIKEFSNKEHTLLEVEVVGEKYQVNFPNGSNELIKPENAVSFHGWVNALGNPPDLTKKEDINLFPSFEYEEKQIHSVRFMYMNGSTLLSSTPFEIGQTKAEAGIKVPLDDEVPVLQDMKFTGWGVRTDTGTIAWDQYDLSLATGDVVVYAQYQYSGALNMTPVDADGDGDIDHYQVDSTAGLSGELKIPGHINGVPVAVVVDISDDGEINGMSGLGSIFDPNDGITKIIFNEGTTTIGKDALAMTADLKAVDLPHSIESLGVNAFASDLGTIVDKKLTITYAGTRAEWDKVVSQSDPDWCAGLTKGTTVVCTDGYYELTNIQTKKSGSILNRKSTNTYTWTWHPHTIDSGCGDGSNCKTTNEWTGNTR